MGERVIGGVRFLLDTTQSTPGSKRWKMGVGLSQWQECAEVTNLLVSRVIELEDAFGSLASVVSAPEWKSGF